MSSSDSIWLENEKMISQIIVAGDQPFLVEGATKIKGL